MPSHTLQEILSQPQVWHSTLRVMELTGEKVKTFLKDIPEDTEIVLTGCGTSYYLPLAAASFYTGLTGEPSRAVPASDIMIFPEAVFAKGKPYLLIPISRKGETDETNRAARYAMNTLGARTLAISCSAETTLSEICEWSIVSAAAAEKSKFMTKSFTSMLLMFQYLTALSTSHEEFLKELSLLPGCCEKIIGDHRSSAEYLAAKCDCNLFIYLGQGPFYGLAAECMLKIKEMACTPAEAYHSLELMHGPKYAVTERTLVTVLLSDSGLAWEVPLLAKIKSMGAKLAVLCDTSTPEIDDRADVVIELKSGLSEYARLLLYMPVVQLFGYYRAIFTGKEIE